MSKTSAIGMYLQSHRRKVAVAAIGLLTIFGALSWLANVLILNQRDYVLSDANALPFHRVGLVLGTSRLLSDGRENFQFTYRMQAALELYRAGKIRIILVSGDNHISGYDEPTDMRNTLTAAGVPVSAIISDYAGFRTFDSIIRAHKVFGLDDVTIISQRYHDYRAVAIARYFGLDAVAYCAQEVPGRVQWRAEIREYLARMRACLDLYLLPTQPHFLGPRIAI